MDAGNGGEQLICRALQIEINKHKECGMKGKRVAKKKGRASSAAVNLLAPGWSMLPPKLPTNPSNKQQSEVLKFRILPGWHDTEDGRRENPQLDMEAVAALENEESLIDRAGMLGDWAYCCPVISIEKWNSDSPEKKYSWLPGWCVRDVGTDEPQLVQSPAAVMSWKWFEELKPFAMHRRDLFSSGSSGKEVAKELARKFDMTSVRAVEQVSAPFDAIIMQVMPLVKGGRVLKLDPPHPKNPYSRKKEEEEEGTGREGYSNTLLVVQQKAMIKVFVEQLTMKQEGLEDEPLSVETSKIGEDIISSEGGHDIEIQRQSTAVVLTVRKQLPLGPSYSDPESGGWVPWEGVFQEISPEDSVATMIEQTSPAAVDWALKDTEYESLIPDNIRGAGDSFNPYPVKIAVAVDGSGTDASSEETTVGSANPPAFPGDNRSQVEKNADAREAQEKARARAKGASGPQVSREQAESLDPVEPAPLEVQPDKDTAVSDEANSQYEKLRKDMYKNHSETTGQ